MEASLAVASDEGDLPLGEDHNMDSDDAYLDGAGLNPGHDAAYHAHSYTHRGYQRRPPARSTHLASTMMANGRLPPVSGAMDIPVKNDTAGDDSATDASSFSTASSTAAGSFTGGFGASHSRSNLLLHSDTSSSWQESDEDASEFHGAEYRGAMGHASATAGRSSVTPPATVQPKQEPGLDDGEFFIFTEDVPDYTMADMAGAAGADADGGADAALNRGGDHEYRDAAAAGAAPDAPVKRRRGRPRKHPPKPPRPPGKVVKGRSKTGCITCRKRKKKCDESKPRCMNCEKNGVICEGYQATHVWKSGKEIAEEESAIPRLVLPPIIDGVETTEDKIFWKHFLDNLSSKLTVETETQNAFRTFVVPIARAHRGVIHAVLSLSAKHIDLATPYGRRYLLENPTVTPDSLQRRGAYHHREATHRCSPDRLAVLQHEDREAYEFELKAVYCQILCFLLESMAEGNPHGDHRVHLQGYQSLMAAHQPRDDGFRIFIMEFFEYHIYADHFLHPPQVEMVQLSTNEWNSHMVRLQPPRLIGVNDGLFRQLSRITRIRNGIRHNINHGIVPVVDYRALHEATDIETEIGNYEPVFPHGDGRRAVSTLYRCMMWVHLFRTMYPPDRGGMNMNIDHPPRSGMDGGYRHPAAAPGTSSPGGDVSDYMMGEAGVQGGTPPMSSHSSVSSPGSLDHQSHHQLHQQHVAAASQMMTVPSPAGSGSSTTAIDPSVNNDIASAASPITAAAAAAGVPMSHSAASLHHQSGSHHDIHQHQQHPQGVGDDFDRTATSFDHFYTASGTTRGNNNADPDAVTTSPPPSPRPILRGPCWQDPKIENAIEQFLTLLGHVGPSNASQTLLLMPCVVVGVACFAPHQRAKIDAAIRNVKGYTGLRNADRARELLEVVWERMDLARWSEVWDWESIAAEVHLDFLAT